MNSSVGPLAVADGVVDPAVPEAADERGGAAPPVDAPEATAGGPPPAEGEVAGSGYWSGMSFPKDDAAGMDYLGTVLHASGVRTSVGHEAVKWLHQASQIGDTLTEHSASHGYDLSRYHFSGIDAAYANHFANAMRAKGATQAEVDALLRTYQDGQQRQAKRQEQVASGRRAAKPATELGLEEIRAMMKNKASAYWRGPDAENIQRRYRQLLGTAGR